MPIVDIEFVGPIESDSQTYADRLADVFESAPGSTWVRLRSLDPACYAENGSPTQFRPVFVSVLLRERPSGEALHLLAGEISETVATLARRSNSEIHVLFEERGAGRLAFGGGLIPD